MSGRPKSCQECCMLTNSSQLHDDAFTSAPYPMSFYCGFLNENRFLVRIDVVDKNCPLYK